MADVAIRRAEDADAGGLVALIEGCFHEYEGCLLDPEGIDKPLFAIGSWALSHGGDFWVAEEGSLIVGSIGWLPEEGRIELMKLYVRKSHRRQGLASRLLKRVEDVASRRGEHIHLWSDTRFLEAHKFYKKHGFRQLDESRALNDISNSIEYHFERPMPRTKSDWTNRAR